MTRASGAWPRWAVPAGGAAVSDTDVLLTLPPIQLAAIIYNVLRAHPPHSWGDLLPVFRGNTPYNNDNGGFQPLPVIPQGYYEYDIYPFRAGVNRGPHRLVVAGSPGATPPAYYTPDHYNTFFRIR
jgi:hypothetical protein